VAGSHFVRSGIRLSTATKITVQNCEFFNTHSQLFKGSRGYNYRTEAGQYILFKNNRCTGSRHAYAGNGTSYDSGVVYLRNTNFGATVDASESHRRWGTGFLYDNHTEDRTGAFPMIGLMNRGDSGTGHGWSAAHSVVWNTDMGRSNIRLHQPPTAQNYAIGIKSTHVEPVTGSFFQGQDDPSLVTDRRNRYLPYEVTIGFVEGVNNSGRLVPESLYEAQLRTRRLNANPSILTIPGTIQVENFVAKNGSVRTENTPGGGQNLGFIRNGDYTEYTVNVSTTGSYNFSAFTSSNGRGGNMIVSSNGTNLGTIAIPVNNNWHSYSAVSRTIRLRAGRQTIRFRYTGSSGFLFNFERARFTLNTTVANCNVAPSGFSFSNATSNSITFNYNNTSNDTRTFEMRVYEDGTYPGSINGGSVISFSAAAAGSTSITSRRNLRPNTVYDVVFRSLCNPGGSPLVFASGTTSGRSSKLINSEITISPNPTTTDFFVTVNNSAINAIINVYNLQGQLIKSSVALSNKTLVDLSDQANGLYIINVVKNNTIVTVSKLIKK